MRPFFALIIALCLIVLFLPATADSPPTPLPGYTLRDTPDEIRVFASKSMKANIVGYISPDRSQEVQILTVDGDWCYISFTSIYGVSYGYIPLAYIDVTPVASPTPASNEKPVYQGGTPAWIINASEGRRLNLREEPSATARSLGKYYTGTPLILTGNMKNDFVQVLLAGTTFGWLDARYITLDALAFVPETPMVTVHNPGGGAVLRSGPNTSYDRIGWYAHGTIVTVLGVRNDGWYHIQAEDQVGFIAENLLSGQFSFELGMDSDNLSITDNTVQYSHTLYINTRSNDGQLHLRKAASVSAKSLGLFYTGTPVTVLNYTRDGWACVRIGQTEGYMDADYLTATPPTQYGVIRTVRNTRATGLNLRTLPSTGGELLDFAPNYTTLTILGELNDGWCYVDLNGILGYMSGTYLK